MYYILAEQTTGNLIQVSTEYMEAAEGQVQKIREGSIPDLSKFEWDSGSLAFIEKQNSRFFTQEQFVRRFTDSELRNIYGLAKNNLDVEIWLDRFKMAKEIDLDDPFLVNGLYGLSQAGLFTVERVLEILE